MPVHAHTAHAVKNVHCAVLAVSDTRTAADDTSGRRIKELLSAAGHVVEHYEVLRDDASAVAARVRELLDSPKVAAVILTGGTGLAPRDTTFEAVRGILDKEISGFGELFRYLSFAEIGPAAMLSRATAGVAREKIVVSIPGSTAAVELALTKLVLPELGHMVFLARGR
jgi:molybdenum cofactor biosynthesis protein B